jgi:hypothetical protein
MSTTDKIERSNGFANKVLFLVTNNYFVTFKIAAARNFKMKSEKWVLKGASIS